MMQEEGRGSRQGARSASPGVEVTKVNEGPPEYDHLISENAELKKRLQQERGMRQLYAKKLEEAEEEWLEQVEQLQAYVKSIRYTMADAQNVPYGLPSSHAETMDPSEPGNRSSLQASTSSPGNVQSRREKRIQVVQDLKGAFEAKTSVLEDDVSFIREVKEGVSLAPEMDPERELQELAKKFRAWKSDFKEKLRATSERLKRINKENSASLGRSSRTTVRSSQRGRSPGSPSSLETGGTGSDPDGGERRKDLERRGAGFMKRLLSIRRSS